MRLLNPFVKPCITQRSHACIPFLTFQPPKSSATTQSRNLATFQPTTSFLSHCRLLGSTSPQIRSLSTKSTTKTKTISTPKTKTETTLLELASNQALNVSLSKKGWTLGPLTGTSKLILGLKGLRINPVILHLDIQTMEDCQIPKKSRFQEVMELKEEGGVRIGRYSKPETDIIMARYQKLVTEAKVNQKDLSLELFPLESSVEHKIQSNLIGFFLLQDLPGGHLRLPVDVVNQLGNLLYKGDFTKKEDAAILAWVTTNGTKNWAKLANSLGRRNYYSSRRQVQVRYCRLKDKAAGKMKGEHNVDEMVEILEAVFEQKPSVLEDCTDVDWASVAAKVNRPNYFVTNVFTNQLQPTILRYKAKTLDQDVRPRMISYAKEKGWEYSIHMDFKLMVSVKGFEGHTCQSLLKLYSSIQKQAMKKHPEMKSMKEVTLKQVEEYWKTSERRGKNKREVQKEQQIVEAYTKVMADTKSKKTNKPKKQPNLVMNKK